MGYNLLVNGIYWGYNGYNPLILTMILTSNGTSKKILFTVSQGAAHLPLPCERKNCVKHLGGLGVEARLYNSDGRKLRLAWQWCTLPETNKSQLKIDGCETTFPLRCPISRGYVNFREGK